MSARVIDRDPENETTRDLDVVSWRYDRLVAAGYPPNTAIVLADSPVDLHQALDLLANGCSPRQALRILL
jgi:protoporphyrinogen oxidase